MSMAGDEELGVGDRQLNDRLRRAIWEPMAAHADDNEIGNAIEEGVALVEGFCRPVLEWVDQP